LITKPVSTITAIAAACERMARIVDAISDER
jgi:hypothetical protein